MKYGDTKNKIQNNEKHKGHKILWSVLRFLIMGVAIIVFVFMHFGGFKDTRDGISGEELAINAGTVHSAGYSFRCQKLRLFHAE